MNAAMLGAARRRAKETRELTLALGFPLTGLRALYDFAQGPDPQVLLDRSRNRKHGVVGKTSLPEAADGVWVPTGMDFNGSQVTTIDVQVGPARTYALALTSRPTTPISVALGNGYVDYVGISNNKAFASIQHSGANQATLAGTSSTNGVPVSIISPRGTLGSQFSLWVNGVMENRAAQTYAITNDTLKYAGNYNGSNNGLNGILHAVAIYDIVIADADIPTLHNALKTLVAKRGVILP